MSDLTELEAYLAMRCGPPGQVRPLHAADCPAREAWVPLIQCGCRLALTAAWGGGPGA